MRETAIEDACAKGERTCRLIREISPFEPLKAVRCPTPEVKPFRSVRRVLPSTEALPQ
jgi:hypothetical protein